MTDKELLEAAARAVGLEHRGYVDDFFDPEMNVSIGLMYGCPTCVWNPLTDDGDAFRLQSDLWISVEYVDRGVKANNIWFAIFDGDTAKYSRRAITEAAARMVKK